MLCIFAVAMVFKVAMMYLCHVHVSLVVISITTFLSGCPEAVKVLVGNKCDLPADVDLSQAKVSNYCNTKYIQKEKKTLTTKHVTSNI